MTQGQNAPAIPGLQSGKKALLVFFETDCPTCQLALPYLNALKRDSIQVIGLSQDDERLTKEFVSALKISYPVELDSGLRISRAYDPHNVPTFFLLDESGQVEKTLVGFDKQGLNDLAAALGHAPIAPPDDGAPAWKPGCSSRHLEPEVDGGAAEGSAKFLRRAGDHATRITLRDDEDPFEYCRRQFGDALPVAPPTEEKVEAMVRASGLAPETVIARVPPFYGEATVEKIAANAVMAGCEPEMMRVLLPLMRAACDERFNIHGVQATTHFAAPLVMINGQVRQELGFWSKQNVFSNVARANSSLGRAFQLVLLNIGGGRPDGIDMSALGNPGKFSFCIAENEEENPWEPFHVTRGLKREQSAVSLFAAEPPRGVSEHTAPAGKTVLETISFALATVWSYRMCLMPEAIVVLCPEHVKTIHRDGFTKAQVRQFLFENTGIPVRYYSPAERAEGTQLAANYKEITIRGEKCYQKFRSPEAISILVAGGTAGKFSAVIGSWSTGPAGSQMVTYPIPDK
ncbi:MAG TPA: TlpA disulfide reductase family protein [Candidatus Angelobacter sp.]|jgi:peroxiredoxin|nr:TlpA disulfide reductase family protein [Candidatus Angelobacter sp.]